MELKKLVNDKNICFDKITKFAIPLEQKDKEQVKKLWEKYDKLEAKIMKLEEKESSENIALMRTMSK